MKFSIKAIAMQWYQRQRRKNMLRLNQYYSVGEGSHFEKRFSLDLHWPTPGHKYLVVGRDCIINGNFVFESQEGLVEIGDNCSIGLSTFISRTRISIGNNVYVAWGSTFYDHNSHSLDYRERRKDLQRELSDLNAGRFILEHKDWSVVKSKPIVIEDDAWIGMNCLILKGVTIGRGAVVGAGSVVTKDVPPFTVVGGNPAQIIKRLTPE